MKYRPLCALLLAGIGVAGCSQTEQANVAGNVTEVPTAAGITAAPEAPDYANMAIEVPSPGQPGGLPDDRTPLAEGPIVAGTAADAGQVVQQFAALIEQKRFDEAAKLWEGTPPDLAARFARYARIGANIGSPGAVEGGAGQLNVAVPIQLYGRLDDGQVVNALGSVALHRVNDVDGATAEQRRWRITKVDADPKPYAP